MSDKPIHKVVFETPRPNCVSIVGVTALDGKLYVATEGCVYEIETGVSHPAELPNAIGFHWTKEPEDDE